MVRCPVSVVFLSLFLPPHLHAQHEQHAAVAADRIGSRSVRFQTSSADARRQEPAAARTFLR